MLQIQQYTSSGLLPIEAILDIKYMTLFNNICRQHDDAIEKQLAIRQLNIKTTESKSWFTILKKTLIIYDFSNINELLAKPPKKIKSMWKSLIMKAVERYWAKKIREIATWYPSLERLNSEIYKPKLYHPILNISRDLNLSKAAMSIGIKIRLVTGTYFLQEVCAKYACVSPLCECELCDEDVENLDDFLLKCKVLHAPRLQHLSKINDILEDHIDTSFDSLDSATKIQMIIVGTTFRNSRFELTDIAEQQMEQNSRIMCYALHCIRSRTITRHRRKSDKRK
jgi:hypothetical protein